MTACSATDTAPSGIVSGDGPATDRRCVRTASDVNVTNAGHGDVYVETLAGTALTGNVDIQRPDSLATNGVPAFESAVANFLASD